MMKQLGTRYGRPEGSDAEWEALLHASHGYLCITDADTRIRFLSRAPLGHGVGRFVGKPLPDFIDKEYRPLALDAFEHIRAGAPMIEFETRGAESGRWYQLRIVGIRERGVLGGFAVHALDIEAAKQRETEQGRLRSRLQAAAARSADADLPSTEDTQRRFDVIADALPVLISYVDKERRYQFNNSAYERWFRTSRQALRGREVADVVGAAAYEQLRPYVDAALHGQAVSFELTLPYHNAGLRRVSAHYVPDVTAAGDIAGFYALIEDVSERSEAEAALRQREDQVRQLQKLEALGRLAGGMAHDFGNLLQVVTSSCDSVLKTLPEDRSERQEILRIRSAAQRSASLTRQLMSFSRKSDVEAMPLEVDAVLRDMEPVLGRLLGSSIRVEFDLDARSLIVADAGQIQQILLNLAINARDAMPSGGSLRVASAPVAVPDERAANGACRPGNYVMLTVTDTGTGMDADTLQRIFEPFFTTKARGSGTGLGLSSVYGIVQSLGGHIDVKSVLGEGSTFRVYFPLLETREPLRGTG